MGSLLLLALVPLGAVAADIETQSSTRNLWYSDSFQDKCQGDLLEYVKFGATKIDVAGRFSNGDCGRVNFT